jgi:hypothetical protein
LTTSPPPRVRVPRQVARLISWLVVPLVVDYSASRRLVVDYFASAAHPGASARRAARDAARRAARCRLLRVARLVPWLVERLVVDYSASRRLVVDYLAYAARPGASTRRAARRRLLRRSSLTTPRHAGTSRGSSRGSSRRSSSTTSRRAGSSSTTSPSPRVWVPQHVARLIVDYSMRYDFVLRPRWLYLSHAVRHDYLSRGNTGSTSTMPRAATTSSSGRITSTIHLD